MSGAWMNAKIVKEAAKLAMSAMIENWETQLQDIITLRGKTKIVKWDGWWFKYRYPTNEEIMQMPIPILEPLIYLIKNPTKNDLYTRMVLLHALATNAETLDEGCKVLVSAEDNMILHSGLTRHESWFECQEQPQS